MASGELKIVLEDVKEKFDTVIEAFNMVKETLDRHIEENREEHQEFKRAILGVEADVSVLKTDVTTLKTDVATLKTDVATLKTDVATLKTDVSGIRKDLNDHRDNTELHAREKRKKA
jgi:chromosome segregation ATPase